MLYSVDSAHSAHRYAYIARHGHRLPRRPTWPPPPRVDSDSDRDREGEPPANTRGALDQESLLDDIAPPPTDDRRFVLVSAPGADGRRKSCAERGNLAHITTTLADGATPPVFVQRERTPYAYSKPPKESTAPSPSAFLRSPEPMTPSATRSPHAAPAQPKPAHIASDDSDFELDDATHLRTERKPARYSFVKSDLQRDDVRAHVRASAQRQSPPSSSPSLDSGSRTSRPPRVDAEPFANSHTPSKPDSPLQWVPSPKFPTRLRQSPPSSRPSSSRGHTRSPSPLAFPSTDQAPSSGRFPVTGTDWHATYPPVNGSGRSRPPSRQGRHETMPSPIPGIDVQSPSSAWKPAVESSLPYPDDDFPTSVFMPLEAHYQFDHSTIASPRQTSPGLPKVYTPSIVESSRASGSAIPSANQGTTTPDEPSYLRRMRSNSTRSIPSHNSRREQRTREKTLPDLDRPLPSCPRNTSLIRYNDWYSLLEHESFDVCPSCYEGVFADTPFSVCFSQIRLYERPVKRICDFSNPWMRLAWLLTIKQRRQSLDLLSELIDVADGDRPCPADQELGTDRVVWYGIPSQRDGAHVENFSVCSRDKRMIEVLFPTMRGILRRLPISYQSKGSERFLCSLRTGSRRFPKYLDLLVELDAEAQSLDQRLDINRLIQLARENAFKGECVKSKCYVRKPWHFIPSLPEFTACEECYDELVRPTLQDTTSSPSKISRSFNKSAQLVPTEDPEIGTSCCLYSPRMRRVWDTSVREDDFSYLTRKVLERKGTEKRLTRERNIIVSWMLGLERGSDQWERARDELSALEREWATWE